MDQSIDVWHGTNQDFDRFDIKNLGLNTANPASRIGFFFTVLQETAIEYAHQASRNLIPQQEQHEALMQRMYEQAENALSQGDYALHEEINLAYEDIEAKALQAEPSGMRILKCRLTYDNPISLDASSNNALIITDLGGVLEDIRQQGHDAVFLYDIMDTPSGQGAPDLHVVIFDHNNIEIIDMIKVEPQVEESLEIPEM